MWEMLKPALIRAGRTFAQAFLAVVLAAEVGDLRGFADLTLLDQAATAGLVAVLSFVHNALEDVGRLPLGPKG